MRIQVIQILLLSSLCSLTGEVLTNRMSFTGPEPVFPYPPTPNDALGYSITTYRDPNSAPPSPPYHVDWFYSENSTNFIKYTQTADINADWYLVNYGDELSPANVANLSPLIDIPQNTFYGGLFLHLNGVTNVIGWAEFANQWGVISLVQSGVSYGPNNPGVYVGTYAQVPEPTTFALEVLFGFILSASLKWFRA